MPLVWTRYMSATRQAARRIDGSHAVAHRRPRIGSRASRHSKAAGRDFRAVRLAFGTARVRGGGVANGGDVESAPDKGGGEGVATGGDVEKAPDASGEGGGGGETPLSRRPRFPPLPRRDVLRCGAKPPTVR